MLSQRYNIKHRYQSPFAQTPTFRSFTDSVIGIFGIFIGRYINFIKEFISDKETYFLPDRKKIYYIVTDKKATDEPISKLVQKYNIILINVPIIGWPYETLYRFKYFNMFAEKDIAKADIFYFMNANAIFTKIAGNEVLPDSSGYVFSLHHSYLNKGYHGSTFEKNPISTAYMRPNIKGCRYLYYAGGFYGAIREKFIGMAKYLEKNIDIDEQNNYIAEWHDESHINKFCNIVLRNRFKLLGIDYHVFEETYDEMEKYDPKLVYLSKTYLNNANLDDKSKFTLTKITNGNVMSNPFNTHLLVSPNVGETNPLIDAIHFL